MIAADATACWDGHPDRVREDLPDPTTGVRFPCPNTTKLGVTSPPLTRGGSAQGRKHNGRAA